MVYLKLWEFNCSIGWFLFEINFQMFYNRKRFIGRPMSNEILWLLATTPNTKFVSGWCQYIFSIIHSFKWEKASLWVWIKYAQFSRKKNRSSSKAVTRLYSYTCHVTGGRIRDLGVCSTTLYELNRSAPTEYIDFGSLHRLNDEK